MVIERSTPKFDIIDPLEHDNAASSLIVILLVQMNPNLIVFKLRVGSEWTFAMLLIVPDRKSKYCSLKIGNICNSQFSNCGHEYYPFCILQCQQKVRDGHRIWHS